MGGTVARGRGTALALVLLALAGAARAESAWVRDEVRLNLRTGPGVSYRILGVVKTGDRVEIMRRLDGWTQVRTGEDEGYIPAGFLQPEPPARIEVETLRAQVDDLTRELSETGSSELSLREENRELEQRDEEQRALIDRLSVENRDLKAGERWPYLITGAAILCAGMLVGAIVQALAGGRRARRRIRL